MLPQIANEGVHIPVQQINFQGKRYISADSKLRMVATSHQGDVIALQGFVMLLHGQHLAVFLCQRCGKLRYIDLCEYVGGGCRGNAFRPIPEI
jgi:hypothetical protein